MSDAFGKSFRQDFKLSVIDINEDPALVEETITVSEGSEVQMLTIGDPEGADVTVKQTQTVICLP